MKTYDFKRGKDKKPRKKRIQGFKTALRNKAQSLNNKRKSASLAGVKKLQTTSKKVRKGVENSQAVRKLAKPTVKGGMQYLGGRAQLKAATTGNKKGYGKERLKMGAKGVKNIAVGAAKAAPGAAIIKADQMARKFENTKFKTKKKKK